MKFEDLLHEYSVPLAPEGHEHKRKGWVQFDCPFCNVPGHYRMGYNSQYGYVNCWACGRHGLADTLIALTDLSYAKCRALLRDIERPSRVLEIKKRGKLELPPHIKPLAGVHKRYLRGRGFDVTELVKLWNLQGIGLSGRLSWRIFIPIYFAGEIVSWTTRSVSDTVSKRYIAADLDKEAIPHKELLYGEEYARHAIIICEGPADVWRIGPGAVATCGTSYSQAQVERMSKYLVRVVCFDNERGAQRRARKLCDSLEVFDGDTYRVTLKAKDPGSAMQKEINHLRKEFLNAV